MQIQPYQFAYQKSSGPVSSLPIALQLPTVADDLLIVLVKWNSLTGTPVVGDYTSNFPFVQAGSTKIIDSNTACAAWVSTVKASGADTVTITASGGDQTLEVFIVEVSLSQLPSPDDTLTHMDQTLTAIAQALKAPGFTS